MVSIIIPVYNAENYLSRCIDSVLSQSFTDFELLLIDDGSTDGSGSICDDYAGKDGRIRVYHRVNAGSAATRQFGFELAVGEYIAAVDADDWVDSDYLESMVSLMEKDGSDIVVSAYWKNEQGKDSYFENKPQGYDAIAWQKSFLEGSCHAGLWNKLLRKSLLCGPDALVPKYDFFEDMVVSISYLQQCRRLSYCPTATYHYCWNAGSLTYDKDVNKRVKCLDEMLNNMRDMYSHLPDYERNQLKQGIDRCVNVEKIRMLESYPDKYGIYKHLLVEEFPNSYPIKKVKGLSTLCSYLALKGFILPYRVLRKLRS